MPKTDQQKWMEKRAVIAGHRMHARAARQQARYDVDALETAAYHDAEAERLEAELEAAGHKRPRGARYRKNPSERGALLVSELPDDARIFDSSQRQWGRMVWADPHRSYRQEVAEPAGWFPDMSSSRNWSLRWMSPQEFLRTADPTWEAHPVPAIKERGVESVIAAVQEGVVFAPLMLDPAKPTRTGGLSHEGRHRAEAAVRLGEKTVPVLVSMKHLRFNPHLPGAWLAEWCASDESYAVLDETSAAGSSWMAGACVLLAKAIRKAYPDARLVGIETPDGIQHVGAEIGDVVFDALGGHSSHSWEEDWLAYEQLPANTPVRVVSLKGVPRSALPDAESPATPADVAIVAGALPDVRANPTPRDPGDWVEIEDAAHDVVRANSDEGKAVMLDGHKVFVHKEKAAYGPHSRTKKATVYVVTTETGEVLTDPHATRREALEQARRVLALKSERNNPGDWVTIEDAAYDAHADDARDVDDWVTIEECACSSCAPMRLNPRAPKRKATGAYADLDSIVPVIAEALAKHGLTMAGIEEVKFTRGGKSRAGSCAYSRTLNKCQILFNGLAWPAFTEESRLNTVLHEAAHAIQFLTTGRSDHGPVWQKIAKSIGCTGDRCMTLEASQAMLDAYAEAKGLPKAKLVTREAAREASADFAVGDYVSFEHKRQRLYGKITRKDDLRASVIVTQPATRAGITGKIPYPELQKEAPPRHAEKVAGVDKPAPGESLSAWQARTGRPDFLSLQRVERRGARDNPTPPLGDSLTLIVDENGEIREASSDEELYGKSYIGVLLIDHNTANEKLDDSHLLKGDDYFFLSQDEPIYWIEDLEVARDKRGLGLGRKLVEAAIHDVKQDVWLISTPSGDLDPEGFYKKLGFNPIKRNRFYGFVLMVRRADGYKDVEEEYEDDEAQYEDAEVDE